MWERNIGGLPLERASSRPNLQCRHVPWPGIKPPQFALWDKAEPTEPHWPGPGLNFIASKICDLIFYFNFGKFSAFSHQVLPLSIPSLVFYWEYYYHVCVGPSFSFLSVTHHFPFCTSMWPPKAWLFWLFPVPSHTCFSLFLIFMVVHNRKVCVIQATLS